MQTMSQPILNRTGRRFFKTRDPTKLLRTYQHLRRRGRKVDTTVLFVSSATWPRVATEPQPVSLPAYTRLGLRTLAPSDDLAKIARSQSRRRQGSSGLGRER